MNTETVSNSGRCDIFRTALQILTSRRNFLLISLARDKLKRLQEPAVLTHPQLWVWTALTLLPWNSLECYVPGYISELVNSSTFLILPLPVYFLCAVCFRYCILLSFIHSFIRSFIHSLIHSFIHSFIRSFIHSLIHSLTHSFIHASIHSFIHSFTHLFIYSFTQSIIHSFIMALQPLVKPSPSFQFRKRVHTR
jgi:hypothetical protein